MVYWKLAIIPTLLPSRLRVPEAEYSDCAGPLIGRCPTRIWFRAEVDCKGHIYVTSSSSLTTAFTSRSPQHPYPKPHPSCDTKDFESRSMRVGLAYNRGFTMTTQTQNDHSATLFPGRALLRIQEVASACGVSSRTVLRAIADGELNVVQAPGTRGHKGKRITNTSFNAWLEKAQ